MTRTLIFNGRLVLPQGEPISGWILIEGDRIADIGSGPEPEASVRIDAKGGLIMPGMVDTHVHFREPGLTRKATIASESRAALLGGVTSYLEMPNTVPPTTTIKAIGEKKAIAAENSPANYGFFLGASDDNIDEIRSLDPHEIPGIKLFIGSSTGNMAVNSAEALDAVFEAATVPVMVHAEDDSIIKANAMMAIMRHGGASDAVPVEEHSDIRSPEACLQATRRALELARRHGTRLHVAHVSTKAELDLLEGLPGVTTEVTPLHLAFDSSDYFRKGSRVKVNPAVKTPADRRALLDAARTGRITTIGSDHAPHLPEEKQGGALKAASGAPSVQFALPVLLDMLQPQDVARLYASAPAHLFGIEDRGELRPGAKADVIIVEEGRAHKISDSDAASPCGWTPFEGMNPSHSVRDVWVNGRRAVADGNLLPDLAPGEELVFNHIS